MVTTSLKTAPQSIAVAARADPEPVVVSAFPTRISQMNYPGRARNTLLYAVPASIGTLLSCSLVAYGFAIVKWPGRNIVFVLVLATMMLPSQVTLIPLYVIFAKLGWTNTYLPLILPTCVLGGAVLHLPAAPVLPSASRGSGRCRAHRRRERTRGSCPGRHAAVDAGPDHGLPAHVHRQVERLLRAADLHPGARAVPARPARPGVPGGAQDGLGAVDVGCRAHLAPARHYLLLRPAQIHRRDHAHRQKG